MVKVIKGKTIVKAGTNFERSGQQLIVGISGAKVGATAGWTVNNGVDTAYANCPASQSAATLILPIPNLPKNAKITGFYLQGGINSAGNTATVDANLRKQTPAAAATPTDASVASITQISKTAATAINQSNSEKNSLTEVVDGTASYYLKITSTTAASTSAYITGAVIEYTAE